jgi:hypothetical protein
MDALDRIRRGDEEALTTLFAREWQGLVRFLDGVTNQHVAELTARLPGAPLGSIQAFAGSEQPI